MDRAQGRTPGSNPVDLTGHAQHGYKRTGYCHSYYHLQACNSGEGGSGAKLDTFGNGGFVWTYRIPKLQS